MRSKWNGLRLAMAAALTSLALAGCATSSGGSRRAAPVDIGEEPAACKRVEAGQVRRYVPTITAGKDPDAIIAAYDKGLNQLIDDRAVCHAWQQATKRGFQAAK